MHICSGFLFVTPFHSNFHHTLCNLALEFTKRWLFVEVGHWSVNNIFAVLHEPFIHGVCVMAAGLITDKCPNAHLDMLFLSSCFQVCSSLIHKIHLAHEIIIGYYYGWHHKNCPTHGSIVLFGGFIIFNPSTQRTFPIHAKECICNITSVTVTRTNKVIRRSLT